MTSKVYKTAQGKAVDLGTIMLQNEHTRAVGNMNVNARGDRLGSGNKVIETKNRQIQKQNNRTSVPAATVHTSSLKAKRARQQVDETQVEQEETIESTVDQIINDNSIAVVTAPPAQDVPAGGGLAAAIARSKIVKQEKEKTARELAQSKPGVKKI